MRRLFLLSLLLAGLAPQESGLVVHEWGTFTAVAGSDGASLDWRPLAGADDLPSFVYQIGGAARGLRNGGSPCGCGTCAPEGDGPECRECFHRNCACKKCIVATVRMETPVLYFYSPKEITARVRVDFPRGRITEWYPKARGVGTGIDWGTITVLPGHEAAFPTEPSESHYYPARETSSAPVRICEQDGVEYEKFLFYRGTGTFDLPLEARLDGDRVRIRRIGKDSVDPVILFENRAGKIGYRVSGDANGEAILDLPDSERGVEELCRELTKVLLRHGLYPEEAQAMIRTWTDSWFEEGLRIFYVVPRPLTDEILPLTIEPAPSGLERVLVGRVELITPEMERDVLDYVRKLGDDSLESREEASALLRRYGRFAEAVLRNALPRVADPEIRARIDSILGAR